MGCMVILDPHQDVLNRIDASSLKSSQSICKVYLQSAGILKALDQMGLEEARFCTELEIEILGQVF